MFIPKIVCVDCQVPFKCEKNGVVVETFSSFGSYYKIEADRYVCPKCGQQVITGFAGEALGEHYQPDYGPIEVDHSVDL